MKSAYLSLLCFLPALAISAQNAPIDFETGGNGADWTWTVFENVDNPELEIVANPDVTTANSTATVAKFTARQEGAPYAGCESMHGSDIGPFTLNADNSTIEIAVYKSVISNVGIKLVESSSASLGQILVSNTLINEWEVLSFNFSAQEGILFDQIVVFPDFAERNEDHIIYFDEITLGESVPLAVPMAPAPTPTVDAANVISLYSDAYIDAPADTWLTPWSSASIEDIEIQTNPTKLYTNLDFAAIETVGTNLIDAADMDLFHMDVWSPNFTVFRIKLVDFGADGQFEGGDDSEHEMVFQNLAQEFWWSFELPLSDFTNLTSRNHIAQILISAEPAGGAVIYMDNVFFSDLPSGLNDWDEKQISFGPNPFQNSIINSNTERVENLNILNIQGKVIWNQAKWSAGTSIDLSSLKEGMYILRGTLNGKEFNQKLLKE